MRTSVGLLVLGCSVLLVAACGGGDANSLVPELEGTPLPTATQVPPTEAVCEIAAPVPLPANFPADVAVPPNYVVSSVETMPYLKSDGIVVPPPDPDGVRGPLAMLEFAIVDNMRATWTFEVDPFADGRGYTFTSQDGREGGFFAAPLAGCPDTVTLRYEIKWVTPPAGG
jgi:hypothetical protein